MTARKQSNGKWLFEKYLRVADASAERSQPKAKRLLMNATSKNKLLQNLGLLKSKIGGGWLT